MPDRQPKYAKSVVGDRLWQGEVASEVVQLRSRLDTIGLSDSVILHEVVHRYAIVLTQDCDLLADYERRSTRTASDPSVPNILFCEATTVESLRGLLPQGKDIWKRIVQNKDERYQCLEAVPIDQDAAGQGLDAIGVDFKRYFTIPTDEVYKRLELGQVKRRCRLVSPYVEQLATRFFYYQYRVALPYDHDVPLSPRPAA
jgi:hypothetical protein